MAKYNTPYRFNVHGVNFDVTFRVIDTNLEYGDSPGFRVTLAFARKVGTTETLVTKSIYNRKDKYDYQQGQRQAFKRLMERVWVNWVVGDEKINIMPGKTFIQTARNIAFDAGMWNTEE